MKALKDIIRRLVILCLLSSTSVMSKEEEKNYPQQCSEVESYLYRANKNHEYAQEHIESLKQDNSGLGLITLGLGTGAGAIMAALVATALVANPYTLAGLGLISLGTSLGAAVGSAIGYGSMKGSFSINNHGVKPRNIRTIKRAQEHLLKKIRIRGIEPSPYYFNAMASTKTALGRSLELATLYKLEQRALTLMAKKCAENPKLDLDKERFDLDDFVPVRREDYVKISPTLEEGKRSLKEKYVRERPIVMAKVNEILGKLTGFFKRPAQAVISQPKRFIDDSKREESSTVILSSQASSSIQTQAQ